MPLRPRKSSPDAPRDPWKDALALLSRRALTSHELARKLRDRGHPADTIEEVVARSVERRFVDDRQSAYNHAARRAEQGRSGPLRVRAELSARGLPDELIDQAVAEAFPPDRRDQDLSRAAERICRGDGFPRERAERDRLAQKLIRRGFAAADVLSWLDAQH